MDIPWRQSRGAAAAATWTFGRDYDAGLRSRPARASGTCSDCCAQRADLYVAPAGDEKAEVDPSQLTAIVQQPICGGCFTPTLHVDAPDGSRLATVEGGCCCIGGNCGVPRGYSGEARRGDAAGATWMVDIPGRRVPRVPRGWCHVDMRWKRLAGCDAVFTVKGPDGEDYGKVVKEAPDDFEELVKQGLTDADIFTMSVPKDAPNELKAAMMTSLLLMDCAAPRVSFSARDRGVVYAVVPSGTGRGAAAGRHADIPRGRVQGRERARSRERRVDATPRADMYFEDEGDCYCNPFICVCGYKCCTCSSCGCLFPCGIFCGDRNSNTCCGWWDWLPCC